MTVSMRDLPAAPGSGTEPALLRPASSSLTPSSPGGCLRGLSFSQGGLGSGGPSSGRGCSRQDWPSARPLGPTQTHYQSRCRTQLTGQRGAERLQSPVPPSLAASCLPQAHGLTSQSFLAPAWVPAALSYPLATPGPCVRAVLPGLGMPAGLGSTGVQKPRAEGSQVPTASRRLARDHNRRGVLPHGPAPLGLHFPGLAQLPPWGQEPVSPAALRPRSPTLLHPSPPRALPWLVGVGVPGCRARCVRFRQWGRVSAEVRGPSPLVIQQTPLRPAHWDPPPAVTGSHAPQGAAGWEMRWGQGAST